MSPSRAFFFNFCLCNLCLAWGRISHDFRPFWIEIDCPGNEYKKRHWVLNKKFFLLYISIHTYNLYNFVFWWCIMAIWRKQIKRTYKLYLVKNPFSPILSEIVVTKLNCDGPLNGVLIRNMALLPLNSFRNSKVIILIYVQENFMRNDWDKISLFFFRHLF